MFDLYLSVEQQKREQQDLDAVHEQADLYASLSSEGRFDGICGLPPTQPQDYQYWDGYQVGLREYWTKKLGVEIETPF
ncbi:hypothetical protein IQ238_14490 [Pleurocapsales cyanobacterium LEGE 06147]|nr:hypothetical protein [Pleurocapsales cyanobacterium LEGE 06147]